MKQGPQLIEELRRGTFNLDDLVGNTALEGFHIAALLGTAAVTMNNGDYASFREGVVTRTNYTGFLSHANHSSTRVGRLIAQKKEGNIWERQDIIDLVNDYVAQTVSDEQMAAVLATIMAKGMQTNEIVALTEAMWKSGHTLDFSELKERGMIGVDKHSTGGLADGVSLVLAPLVAAVEPTIYVPMMSGRGLGHTGGTLDKLESIPGMRVTLSEEEIQEAMRRTRVAIFAQTPAIAPADGLLYRLRDATNCVANIGLIVGSILSKKLGEGTDVLVMDTKTGNGAFLSDLDHARRFARLMCDVGTKNGLRVHGFITDMNQPLGNYVGNRLEVIETVEYLNGLGPSSRFMNVVYTLAQRMISLANNGQRDVSEVELKRAIRDGSAYTKFVEMVQYQGGDVAYIQRIADAVKRDGCLVDAVENGVMSRVTQLLSPDRPIEYYVINAKQEGRVTGMDVTALGEAVRGLGAGRYKPTDIVNPHVGMILTARLGRVVHIGDPLAVVVHDGSTGDPDDFRRYFTVADDPSYRPPPLIKETVMPLR